MKRCWHPDNGDDEYALAKRADGIDDLLLLNDALHGQFITRFLSTQKLAQLITRQHRKLLDLLG